MMLVTISLSTRSRAVLCSVFVTGVDSSVVVVTVKLWSCRRWVMASSVVGRDGAGCVSGWVFRVVSSCRVLSRASRAVRAVFFSSALRSGVVMASFSSCTMTDVRSAAIVSWSRLVSCFWRVC